MFEKIKAYLASQLDIPNDEINRDGPGGIRNTKLSAHGKTAHLSPNAHHTRYLYSQLGNGSLTAHKGDCLVLLGSPPDTVHRALLRKTKSSTPLIQVRRYDTHPRSGIPPRWSGLRVTGHRYLPE